MPTDDQTEDKLPSLRTIAAWLSGPFPPTQREAQRLFETVIPAALDVETADLLDRSRELLRQAAALAGVDPKTLSRTEAALTGNMLLPESCGECPAAKPVYCHGAYNLRCLFEREDDSAMASRPALATIDAEAAFHMPADLCAAKLKESVSTKPPPPFCPKR